MPDQEFLASFGVEIDESGVSRLQQALEKNRALAEELAAAFSRAREQVRSFFRDLEQMPLPSPEAASARVTEQAQGMSIPFSLDFTRASRQLQAFFREAGKSLKLSADASAVVSAGRSALSDLQRLFASSVLPLRAQLTVGTAAGRGVGDVIRTITSLPGASYASSVVNTASRSVQAPVSINVTAAGTDPEAVGRSVYDVAEQYLLRTLDSAL